MSDLFDYANHVDKRYMLKDIMDDRFICIKKVLKNEINIKEEKREEIEKCIELYENLSKNKLHKIDLKLE